MKFFVPGFEDDPVAAAKVWESVRAFAEQQMGAVSARTIFKLDYVHGQKTRSDQVGRVASGNGEYVIAIFEGGAYLVCTASRGVRRGLPMLVGRDEVIHVEAFEEASEA